MTDAERDDALRLERVEGPDLEAIMISGAGPSFVGRGRESEVRLQDSTVSRRHASIERRDGWWYLTDLDSRHGTFVNTIRLNPNEETRVHHEDFIGIGPWALCVVEAGAPTTGPVDMDTRTTIASPSDEYATRPTIFLRLGDSDTNVRELSWQEFDALYRPVIVGFARNAGANAGEADDILQDVMLGFFRASEAFEYDPAKGRFRGYLKRAVCNAIRARHRRKRPEVDADLDRFGDDDDGADLTWNWQWTCAVLERAMAEVRPQFETRTWEAFELYGRRCVPADEVAEQLGMTNESVRHAKSRVARAVRKVVERIRAEEG